MRHQNGVKKIGRTGTHRRAMMRNLATALFRHERIQTTALKAKELRSFADQLITLGKHGDLAARRQAAQDVHDHEVLQKLFGDIATRMKERPGGYTRVLKLGTRRGDAATTALIELVDYKVASAAPAEPAKADKPAKKSKKAAAEAEAK